MFACVECERLFEAVEVRVRVVEGYRGDTWWLVVVLKRSCGVMWVGGGYFLKEGGVCVE